MSISNLLSSNSLDLQAGSITLSNDANVNGDLTVSDRVNGLTDTVNINVFNSMTVDFPSTANPKPFGTSNLTMLGTGTFNYDIRININVGKPFERTYGIRGDASGTLNLRVQAFTDDAFTTPANVVWNNGATGGVTSSVTYSSTSVSNIAVVTVRYNGSNVLVN